MSGSHRRIALELALVVADGGGQDQTRDQHGRQVGFNALLGDLLGVGDVVAEAIERGELVIIVVRRERAKVQPHQAVEQPGLDAAFVGGRCSAPLRLLHPTQCRNVVAPSQSPWRTSRRA